MNRVTSDNTYLYITAPPQNELLPPDQLRIDILTGVWSVSCSDRVFCRHLTLHESMLGRISFADVYAILRKKYDEIDDNVVDAAMIQVYGPDASLRLRRNRMTNDELVERIAVCLAYDYAYQLMQTIRDGLDPHMINDLAGIVCEYVEESCVAAAATAPLYPSN